MPSFAGAKVNSAAVSPLFSYFLARRGGSKRTQHSRLVSPVTYQIPLNFSHGTPVKSCQFTSQHTMFSRATGALPLFRFRPITEGVADNRF